jgi:cardiolipin synthase
MKSSTRSFLSSPVPVLFLLCCALPSGASAQAGAYASLMEQAQSLGLAVPPAPAVPLPTRQAPPKVDTSNPRAIAGLDGDQLAAATPAQRLEMLKTLVKWSHPNQQNQDSYDDDQKNMEKAIENIMASAPDAASFDRLYYNVDESALLNSVSWSKDITDLRKKFLNSAVPGDWDGLGRYIDTVDGASDSGKNFIEFLIDGASVMPPAVAAVKSAKSSINVEVYQLEGDNIGKSFADLLVERAKAGVRVRMVIDKYGSDVGNQQPVKDILGYLNQNGVTALVNKASQTGRRDHRKVMVIDGDTAFTGGMNVGRDYQVNWHDQQTLISGPAVAKIQEAFLVNWRAAGGSAPSPNENLFPSLREYAGGADARVVTHWGQKDRNIKAMYLRAFATAQKSIRIADPYFADPDVVDVLCAAAHRGVKVQIVMPQDNDVAIVQHASRGYYPKLLKAGVEIYEYRGRMAHEKVAVIDTFWSTFGSSNLDSRSLWYNDELNVAATNPGLAGYIEANLFAKDIQNSDHITSYSPGIMDHVADAFHGMLSAPVPQADSLAQ